MAHWSARAQIIARWWGERFLIDDKREAFVGHLAVRVEHVLLEFDQRRRQHDPHIGPHALVLDVDYDPVGELLDAVRDAGVQCSGQGFSAQGIFRSYKTTLIVFADGRCKACEGRGAQFEDVPHFPGAQP